MNHTFICPLCKIEQDISLQRLSHIFPKHSYKHTRLIGQGSDTVVANINPVHNTLTEERFLAQDGYKEKMLCHNCEQFLSKIENYASDFIYSPKLRGRKVLDKFDFVSPFGYGSVFKPVNYIYFKNYILSIILKASLSTLEPFRVFNLGEERTEEIRKIIINNSLSSELNYGIQLYSCVVDDDETGVLIFPPRRHKTKSGEFVYVFVIGMFYFMVAETYNSKFIMPPFRLKINRELPIIFLDKQSYIYHLNLTMNAKNIH